MESSEYFRLQNTALAQVETLTKQMESGQIAQADAEQRIIAIMQTLDQETAGYLPKQRAAFARQRRLIKLMPWALAAAILAAVAYRVLA
jgi:hypothetical protein